MALFGCAKEGLLRQFLRLEHGIPSDDTFSRVFRQVDPQAFEAVFREFMAAFVKANGIKLSGVVAVDGKALRGAYERGKASTPLQMVNVFATEARFALAARKAPGRNEAEGALEVLRMLSLEGCIVTADAPHCHRRFAAAVLARGADYALALKENQVKLHAAVVRRFARAGQHWVLDVVLSEDANRSRKDDAPENLAILRRMALNIVRCHPDRISLRQKFKRAGWDDAFLQDILTHMR